ncbi:cyclopropane-fatty-acyl-phospholipid synthase [filamentous cyanobacterium CCP5]|nr:cyclopropane-fatty-acyl-phospholipid synthase [filamentous cyanobacterium CCP5]
MISTSVPAGIHHWVRTLLAAIQLPLNYQLQFWDTSQLHSEDVKSEYPPLKVTVHHPGVVRSLILQRDPLVLADAYLNGYLDIDGDVEVLVTLFRNLPSLQLSWQQKSRLWLEALSLPSLPLAKAADARERQVAAGPDRDREAIQHHYDVGNDFYRLWLDPHLVYTCAHYESPEMPLAEAQTAKLDLICRKLQLQPGETLIDVGCGWGALLRWAVKHYGVTGYGITLSAEQVAFNQKLIDEEGLGDRLRVELRHYCDLPPQAQYDKLVAIGIIEHVGRKNYPLYFQRMLSLLKPGGLFLNHGITATHEANGQTIGERFINRYFFPNGDLVRLSTILTAMENCGWEIADVDAWRPHYAMTLRHWDENFCRAFDQVSGLIGDRRTLFWRLYFIGCALAFEQNAMGLYQVLLRRQQDLPWNLPLTRQNWVV